MENEIENVKPFLRFCYTVGILPTAYKITFTYEEQVLECIRFIKEEVIPTINNNANVTKELQEKFVELVNYVETYLENLDVQSEINNKLDEMAEQGTLQEIIAQYIQLQGLLCYDTVNDMKNATNLVNGSFTKTYGFYEKNDEGGAFYKIRTITNEDIVDNKTLIPISNNNLLVAELMKSSSMNVKQFGAKGNGTYDDTLSIQKALNTSNEIIIPETNNFYLISDNLTINNNQIIKGYGEKSKLLMPDGLEKSIFDIRNVKNIIIENLKLCNETYQTGTNPNLSKNKIIYTEEVENITIKNCFFENAYSRGIQIFKTKNFNYLNNIFKNATYEMLLLLPEVENVLVDNCIFDTCTSNYINTYLFATGRIDTETYEFATKNVHVQNSKFLNNPNWEGVDTHACLNFYCENNYFENCKVGIMARTTDTSPLTEMVENHGNIFIKNNTIKGTNEDCGIIVGGMNSSTFLVKNIFIENNIIENSGRSNSLGAISVHSSKNVNILNNTIKNSTGSAITLTIGLYFNVKNNVIVDCTDPYMVHFIAGVWFVNFENNTLKNVNNIVNNSVGVRSGYKSIVNFSNNDITANTLYSVVGTNMSGSLNNGTQIGKKGNYVKNEYGIITHYCTDNEIHPATTTTENNVSLTGEVNTKEFSSNNAIYYLTEGEQITIPGAGINGTDLTTIITEFLSRDTFKIKDTISTSISSINPNVTAGTWVEV